MAYFKNKKTYTIAACFDTETTNIGEGNESRAICILYIFNDIRLVDLRNYKVERDDKISLIRYEHEAIDYIVNLIEWGKQVKTVPIICAYNLMFDVQTLMYELNQKYQMKANAQSSTNVYTLDLYEDEIHVLRFWDCFHLEMRGLKAMGDTCGLEKANGDWDYSLIRTCETPLTDDEKYYARRDVQVIPAYLSYLLKANEWLYQDMLGHQVITKTSLVRQMAQKQIGTIKLKKRNGKEMNLAWMFELTCKQELPKDFDTYALRKSCFRGGWTFTAGRFASRVVENVGSLDVTSMHHAFINGRKIPIGFEKYPSKLIEDASEIVMNTKLDWILEHYEQPFHCALHARFTFKNIRLRKGTCFDEWQIACIPSSKFRTNVVPGVDFNTNERQIMQDDYLREIGWHDYAEKPMFAFGKLYEAEMCSLYLSELELWIINQIYEFDSWSVDYGEMTVKFKLPPDYVTLQSNILFETKNDAKIINKNYVEGKPYQIDIPQTIPNGIAMQLQLGNCSSQFFESYYNSTVKGSFNGIYGTMAQDVFKPDYAVADGSLYVDPNSKTTENNFNEKKPKRCKVLYTYGLRIVGGSRMHLAIAMMLLYKEFGNRIGITGGDTDSLKIRCDEDITNDMLLKALEPLHIAVEKAIDSTMDRIRKNYPDKASKLEGIGKFECEKCAGYDRWAYHMEAWNKARVSLSQDGKVHITCAGLSRPIGAYTIENFMEDLINGSNSDFNSNWPNINVDGVNDRVRCYYDNIHSVFSNCLGYNIFVPYSLCFSLEHFRPAPNDYFVGEITDYLGNNYLVNQHQAIALYESGRYLGDTTKRSNFDNIQYLKNVQGLDIDDSEKFLQLDENGKPQIVIGGEIAYEI